MKKYRNFFSFLTILTLLVSCKNDISINNEIVKKNTLRYDIDFPTKIYTHKKYKGKITFNNSMFDTIAEPRRDTTNIRFIIYKPFKPYISSDEFNPVYQDSVLLDNKTIEIEFEFDKPGTYNIGGFARDGIMMGYYSEGIRDSVRIIEHEIILFQKVIVRDSI